MGQNSEVYDDSRGDVRTVGVTLHQCAVIVASLHMGLTFSQWTVVHHVVLWGSVLLAFLWFLCFSSIFPTHNMYFVAFVTMATKEFWLLCLLTAVAALFPRYCVIVIYKTFWPSKIDNALIKLREQVTINAVPVSEEERDKTEHGHTDASIIA